MNGWIKLHRQLLDSSVFQNERLLKLWIWILMKAAHEQRTVRIGLQEIRLQPGEFVCGLRTAGEELNLPMTTVDRLLKILENEHRISRKTEHKKTVINVENWAFYQCKEFQDERSVEQKRKDIGKNPKTNKKNQNAENDINNNTPPCDYAGKSQYADLVFMTTDQHDDLVARFGYQDTERLIAILDNHKGAKGVEYADDYRAILSWCVARLERDKRDGVYDDEYPEEPGELLRKYVEELRGKKHVSV